VFAMHYNYYFTALAAAMHVSGLLYYTITRYICTMRVQRRILDFPR
jgi:hypothetical protein